MDEEQRGIGCRRGWAKFDGGVSVLGVTHDRGDEGRAHFLVAGVTPLCMVTYLTEYCQPVREGGPAGYYSIPTEDSVKAAQRAECQY